MTKQNEVKIQMQCIETWLGYKMHHKRTRNLQFLSKIREKGQTFGLAYRQLLIKTTKMP